MAISWLDRDGLYPLLDGGLSVSLVNSADLDSGIELVGAVVALHGPSGQPQIRRSIGLALLAGDSFALEDDRPMSDGAIGAEAILRVVSPTSRAIAEIYLHSDGTRTNSVETVEIGIIASEDAPTGAVPIPEIEGHSAYLKLEP